MADITISVYPLAFMLALMCFVMIVEMIGFFVMILIEYLMDLFFSWLHRRKGLDFHSSRAFFVDQVRSSWYVTLSVLIFVILDFWFVRIHGVGVFS